LFPQTLSHNKKNSFATRREYITALRKLRSNPGVEYYLQKRLSDPLPYPSAGCSTCVFLLDLALPTIESKSGIDAIINKTEDAVCGKLNATWEKDLCKDLLNFTLTAFSEILLKGKNGGWNVAEDICADLLGACTAPCCTTPYVPEQLSLNFASEVVVAPVMSMRINWLTLNITTGDFIAYQEEASGSSSSTWSFVNTANISQTNSTGDQVWKWYAQYHSGVVTGLKPNTTYTYFVGSDQANSTQNTFTTLPMTVGTAARPLRIAVVADWGTINAQDTTNQIQARVNNGSIDALIMAGDLGYWDGKMERLATFGRQIAPIVSRIPVMTIDGNHDSGFFSKFSEYRHRYPMLPAGYGAPENALYWSINIGPVNFVFLNTETFFDTPDLDQTQMDWAVGRFAAFDAQPGTFLAQFQHRPLYCSAGDSEKISGTCYGGSDSDLLRMQSEYHLNKHHVDFQISGHVHNLNTMYPVRDGQLTGTNFTYPTSPVYAVVGNAGQEESLSSFYPTPLPWDRVRQSVIGYQTLEYIQKTREDGKMHTSCKFTAYQSSDNTVLDTFEIVSSR
jgi:hypothetical protein